MRPGFERHAIRQSNGYSMYRIARIARAGECAQMSSGDQKNPSETDICDLLIDPAI